MKKITRILSVALVAMMVLSLSAVALADDTTVYIPNRLGKLGVDYVIDDFQFPTLKVKMSSTVALGDPCPIVAGDEADYLLYFSEKPDWAGAVVSSLDGGWLSLDVDDTGFATIEGPLHLQPGMWSAGEWEYTPEGVDEIWHVTGGDYPYYAGKDYGDYSVDVSYYRNGGAYKVVVTLKDSADFFRTGYEGGTMKITFEKVTVKSTSNPRKDRYDTYWFISQVSAVYPEGNYIIGVDAAYRNDAKQNLASYRISYAVSEKEIYKITYAPNTTTINEGTYPYTVISSTIPSTKPYIHHYTADEAIYGVFYKSRADWENDTKTAISGSGNKLNKWYKPGHGAQVRNIKKGTTSFKSPRVK